MKKFSFRLQTVLDLRERVKEQKEQELAQLSYQVQLLVERQQQWEAEKDQKLEEQRALSLGTLDLEAVGWYEAYLYALDERLYQGNQQLEQVREAREKKRQELMEATKACEILLKLKERDHREFLLALDRAENQLIDELATVRFNRERNSQ